MRFLYWSHTGKYIRYPQVTIQKVSFLYMEREIHRELLNIKDLLN
jgi:hypothetical protein